MLRFNYNNDNQIFITTLYENLSGDTLSETALTFYFEFKNDQTGKVVSKTLTDNSINCYRYNRFVLNNITEDFIPGWYKYKVYSSDTSDKILEIGRMFIYEPVEKVVNEPIIEKKVYKK